LKVVTDAECNEHWTIYIHMAVKAFFLMILTILLTVKHAQLIQIPKISRTAAFAIMVAVLSVDVERNITGVVFTETSAESSKLGELFV